MSKRKTRPVIYRGGSNPYQSVLSKLDIAAALNAAAKSNDMVPPRPEDRIAGGLGNRFTEDLRRRVSQGTYDPVQAYTVSVQKTNLTTRQASVLTLADRVIYTSLIGAIRSDVDSLLVDDSIVFWPRGSLTSQRWDAFRCSIVDKNTTFVITTDITEFYASIDHQRLGNAIVRATGSQDIAEAIVHFLSRVLDSDRGLPQGLPASDVLSTLYLASLDDGLIQSGLRHARHGDDIRLATDDRSSARRAVLRVESELRALGLHMNGEKTRIYRKDAYLDWVNMHNRKLEEARERRVQLELDAIAQNEDLLEEALGVERVRELLLDGLYRDDDALHEAIEELRDTIQPEKREIAEQLFLDILQKRPGTPEPLGRVAFDRCLRASMVVLTASKSDVALSHIGELLTTVPHQTKLFCSYLTSLRSSGKRVAQSVVAAVDDYATESEFAWVIRVLSLVASHVPDDVVRRLRQIMANPHGQWLAAVEIAKLLATRGELTQGELMSLWGTCPDMFRADLVVAAVRMEPHARWAKVWVMGTKSNAIFSEAARRERAGLQSGRPRAE